MNPPPPPSTVTSFRFPSQIDLTSALSTLTSLLDLSTSTLHSLPIPTTVTTALLPCPFNPNHHLPPSSFFSHHLNCPSPLNLPTPHYPRTLHSTTPPPSLPSTTSDLYFSLENYIGDNTPGNKFFYQNCPGPVTPAIRPPPLLTVPRVLYVECAEFNTEAVPMGFPVSFIRFLSSEIWAIRSEIEKWGGSAGGFTVRVMRSILRLRDCELSHLSKWVVARSPKYGVVIDFAMRDHVVLLVRLCLKAIVREAFGLVGHLFRGGEERKMEEMVLSSQLSNMNFQCPVLGEVLMWLAMQFGVLYGEVNGKFFAVEVLKECILDSALKGTLFPLEEIGTDPGKDNSKMKEQAEISLSIDDCKVNERKNVNDQTVHGSVISIAQVAAAVAALYERSLIEEKIRALREARPLSAYQRNSEHAYVSKIADEERQKRTNYRPIIEHDGLLWQRSHNQGSNKLKTREELLAEERDYKRRRMSYRGKKSKRSTVEVMRDIIEEYMDVIKQFGGIGSTSNTVDEAKASASDNFLENVNVVSGSTINHEVSEKTEGSLHDYRKNQNSHRHHQNLEDAFHQPGRGSSFDQELQDFNRNVKRARPDRDDYMESQDERKNNSSHHSRERHGRETRAFGEGKSIKLHEENYHKREGYKDKHCSRKKERDRHDQNSYERERDDDKREYRDTGKSQPSRNSRKRDGEDFEHRDRRRSKTNRSHSSQSELYTMFGDRYDPAQSRDIFEDDS